jgi:diphthine-ammonia ligase
MESIDGLSLFCSWSGGKDSILALYYAIHHGGNPVILFTMMTEGGQRSRSHGLPISLIREQSKLLKIPLRVASSSWDDYEEIFITILHDFKEQGIVFGVFGDIDIEEHRQWCERVCSVAELKTYHPLWKQDRRELLNEFIELGFEAIIIAIKEDTLGSEFLGKVLTMDLIQDFENAGIDISGEAGEYHTVVTGGPIFTSSIQLIASDQVLRNGYRFLDVAVG